MQSDKCEVNLSNFTKVKVLGRGATGIVYLVQSSGLPRNGLFALKVINKRRMILENRTVRVLAELRLLAETSHPFVITLYYAFQDEHWLYFVLQYCRGGELLDYMESHKGGRMREQDVKFYAAELLVTIEYLHIHGFIHRDLKPANLLIHDTGHLLLTDFDLSQQITTAPALMSRDQKNRGGFFSLLSCCGRRRDHAPEVNAEAAMDRSINRRNSFVGTTEYMAPELIEGTPYAGTVDWWTFGIILYEMLFGKTPFEGATKMDMYVNISDSSVALEFPRSVEVSRAARGLMTRLLTKDQASRLCTPADIKRHAFFKDVNWALLRHTAPPLVPSVPMRSPSDVHLLLDSDNIGGENNTEAGSAAATDSGSATAADSNKAGAGEEGKVADEASGMLAAAAEEEELKSGGGGGGGGGEAVDPTVVMRTYGVKVTEKDVRELEEAVAEERELEGKDWIAAAAELDEENKGNSEIRAVDVEGLRDPSGAFASFSYSIGHDDPHWKPAEGKHGEAAV